MKIDTAIIKLRTITNFSQKELADASGVSATRIGILEKGKSGCRVSTLISLLEAMGYSIQIVPDNTHHLKDEITDEIIDDIASILNRKLLLIL